MTKTRKDVEQELDIARQEGRQSNFEGWSLGAVDLRELNLRGVNLRGVNLRGVNLRGADLRELN
jgi:uncharacterized protein YjbI with pentapeptide repeats